MDADLSHPPERIKDLLAPLFAGSADLVVGSRYVKRRIDTWLAGVAPGRVASRCRACLSTHRPARFDVRFLCHRSFPAAGTRATHQRFQNRFRDDRRARWHAARREIPIVFRERARGKSKMSFSVALRFFLRWLRAMVRITRGVSA